MKPNDKTVAQVKAQHPDHLHSFNYSMDCTQFKKNVKTT